jgi:hypothetical protein
MCFIFISNSPRGMGARVIDRPTSGPENCQKTSLTYFIRSSYTLRCRGFFILIILQTVGLLGRVISSSQGLCLNRGQHTNTE